MQKRSRNFKNLSGLIFGSWFVTDIYEVRTNQNGKKTTHWLCRCSCGLEKFVIGGQLVYGTSTKCKKCGSRKLPKGESARRTVLESYVREAKERGYSWLLTDDSFDALTKRACFYCGSPPSNNRKLPDGSSFIYSGIDRVNNKKGYEVDNVVPCCRICNRAKDTMSKQEFLDWIKRVFKHNEFF